MDVTTLLLQTLIGHDMAHATWHVAWQNVEGVIQPIIQHIPKGVIKQN